MGSAEPQRRPSFARELYAFALIVFAAAALFFAVVPPRAARFHRLRDLELSLEARCRDLRRREKALRGAIEAVERDPFYRAAVVRTVLRVRRGDEEPLPLAGLR